MTIRNIFPSMLCFVAGLLMMVSAACGESQQPEPTATSATIQATATPPAADIPDTPTPRPSVPQTPTPAPTATPTAAPTPVVESTSTSVPSAPRPQPATLPTPDPRSRGGTLTLESSEDIAHQDIHQDVSPALSTWGPGIAYSRLMRLESGPNAALPGMTLECDVCAEWTMESPTSYLFNLRDNVTWQNLDPVGGRTLDADDIIFSYQRQINPDFPNSPLLRNIVALEYLGPLTLRIRFGLPDADSLLALADGHSKIVAPETVIQSGDLRDGPTIGTGPWMLEDSTRGVAHSFSRHPDYFEPDQPLVDNLKILILTDEATRSAAFQTRMTDIHEMDPTEWAKHIQQWPNAASLQIPQPGSGIEVAFKTTEPPFDNVLVRRAAMLSMDPVRIIEEQWEGFGLVGAGFPVASPNWLLTDSEVSSRFDDTEAAKSLLRDAGLASGTLVTITVGDFGRPYLDYAHAVSVGMQSIGFDTRIDTVSKRHFGETTWLQGDFQLMVGPPAPVSTPNGFLLPVFHSEGIWNTTGHRDAELDELLEAQSIEHDPEKRVELIHRIQDRILDQGYRFMPLTRTPIWTWQSRVRDFRPNFSLNEYHHWTSVWIEN